MPLKQLKSYLLVTALSLFSIMPVYAKQDAAWTLVPGESKVSYVSIKKNAVGENNHFATTTGAISTAGLAKVDIDLSSVETYIGIRNQRMVKHVFGEGVASAGLSAEVDLAKIDQLSAGETSTMDVKGSLSLLGKNIPLEATMIVAKLGDQRILVMTDEPILVKTADLGVDAGVDKLKELAKLPGITRVVPVSLRFVFETQQPKSVKKSRAKKTSKAPAEVSVDAGRKLYRQCLGCHSVDKPEHSVGPHLVNIMGRQAGGAEGFAYSAAMKNSQLVWTETTLADFLKDPASVVPGNTMPYIGLSRQQDIDSLVVYLKSLPQS